LLKGQRILVTRLTFYPRNARNLLIVGAITAPGVSEGPASTFASPKEAVGKGKFSKLGSFGVRRETGKE
jgi:hypothetical protein